MSKTLAGIGLLLVVMMVDQGVMSSTSGQEVERPLPVGGLAPANPAHRKCVDDGFDVEPVIVDGIPRDAECVDPKSGRRCGVWAYFRGECHLWGD